MKCVKTPLLLALFIQFTSLLLTAQGLEDESAPVFEFAELEVAPEFALGEKDLSTYLWTHINYPYSALEAKVQGTVLVGFVITSEGHVEAIEVLEGIGSGCDREAKRVIQGLPMWSPGQKNGQDVNCRMLIPIAFTIGENSRYAAATTTFDMEVQGVDAMPQYPGGVDAMFQFIEEEIVYPPKARKKKQEGTVDLRFVIDTDGSVRTVEIMNGLSDDLNREAKRIVSNMPRWMPGTFNGKRVKVEFDLPITFSLPRG